MVWKTLPILLIFCFVGVDLQTSAPSNLSSIPWCDQSSTLGSTPAKSSTKQTTLPASTASPASTNKPATTGAPTATTKSATTPPPSPSSSTGAPKTTTNAQTSARSNPTSVVAGTSSASGVSSSASAGAGSSSSVTSSVAFTSTGSSTSLFNFQIIMTGAVTFSGSSSSRILLIGTVDATGVETAIKNLVGSNAVITAKQLPGNNYATVITLNSNTNSNSNFSVDSQVQNALTKLKKNEASLKAAVPSGLSLAVDTTKVEVTANEILTVNGVQKKVSCTKKANESDITCVKGNLTANGTILVESTSKISTISFSLRTSANFFTVMLFTYAVLYFNFEF